MGDFLCPSDNTDLVECTDFRAKTTMNTENGTIYNCSEDQEIKDLTTGFPDRCIAVFLLTFFVKTIYLSDLTGFVIAANKSYPIRISGID